MSLAGLLTDIHNEHEAETDDDPPQCKTLANGMMECKASKHDDDDDQGNVNYIIITFCFCIIS